MRWLNEKGSVWCQISWWCLACLWIVRISCFDEHCDFEWHGDRMSMWSRVVIESGPTSVDGRRVCSLYLFSFWMLVGSRIEIQTLQDAFALLVSWAGCMHQLFWWIHFVCGQVPCGSYRTTTQPVGGGSRFGACRVLDPVAVARMHKACHRTKGKALTFVPCQPFCFLVWCFAECSIMLLCSRELWNTQNGALSLLWRLGVFGWLGGRDHEALLQTLAHEVWVQNWHISWCSRVATSDICVDWQHAYGKVAQGTLVVLCGSVDRPRQNR